MIASQTSSTMLTGAAALVLAAAHVLGRIAPLGGERMRSFAGGVGTGYVFVVVMPLLSQWQGIANTHLNTERIVFVIAFAGLAIYYMLELWAGRLDTADRDRAAAWVETGGVALYSLAVGFVLSDYGDRSLLWLLSYTAAIGLHFYMNGRVRDDGARILRGAKWLLGGAVLAGWLLGRALPDRLNIAIILFAAMAGAMMLDILKHELPGERQARGWPFVAGGALTALFALFLYY